ncbi:hypothetical protein DRN73_08400 [Candidatus Pacearchaeota archaeon]|nr:MAG: hypothetical protein DRN73_08400 [Candidatus Pacearchaeota archaeon]
MFVYPLKCMKKQIKNLIILSGFFLILFFLILISIKTQFFLKIDSLINSNISLIHNSFLTKLMIFFSLIANPLPFFILFLIVFLILFY